MKTPNFSALSRDKDDTRHVIARLREQAAEAEFEASGDCYRCGGHGEDPPFDNCRACAGTGKRPAAARHHYHD